MRTKGRFQILWYTLMTSILLVVGALTVFGQGNGGGAPQRATRPEVEPASVSPMVTEFGLISLSVDGIGMTNSSGIIQVEKPNGATVRSAYLAAATTGFSQATLSDGDVKIDGVDVAWSVQASSTISSTNYWADVTAIVAPIIDAAPAGRVDLSLSEVNSDNVDGDILAVIFDDPNQTSQNTVILLFGAQNVTGDTFAIGLAEPITLEDPNLALDMGLGISFGCQTVGCDGGVSGQFSQISVNGTRMTSAAGGQDDGIATDGALITVGGLDDSNDNPADPDAAPTNTRSDDELYNLIPFVSDGDQTINVFTINPSNDDNIFFSSLFLGSTTAVVGEGIVLAPSSASYCPGETHIVTATVQDDDGNPIVGREVRFEIISGPHSNTTGTANSDANGQATFSYMGTRSGSDTIQASLVDSQGEAITSSPVTVEWQSCATPTPTPTATPSPTPIPDVASFPFYDGFETSRVGRVWHPNREPDALGVGWSARFTNQGAIRVSTDAAYAGTNGLLLDDLVRDEMPSKAGLILTIDLAGHSDVELAFWWREFNDENNPTDGVFISDDRGATWHEVLSFNNGPSEFRQERIHLDPFVSANGLTFNDHFQIKFQFYDNHPYPNDGYAIDDVQVDSRVKPDTLTPTPIAGDEYESDDSCGEAQALATNGTIQERGFHDAADEDWVKIEATEGITLVIEARVPPDSQSDVLLEIYETCGNSDPQDGQDPNFSEDVRLIFHPPATATYYLRLRDHDDTVFGEDYTYALSVRDVSSRTAPGALIVVAGKLRDDDRVQPNIHHVTNAVYDFARSHGCAPEDILYLAPDMSLDGDGDGLPDVDALVSKAQLQEAITQWAPQHVGPNEPLTIYLMDHGGEERFYLDGANGEWVTPAELDSWLTQLESTVGDLETNIIYEACLSGSFISQPQSISGASRLVISSTGQWSLAYASQEGAIFSDTFIDSLAQGMNLEAAFQEGALAAKAVHPDQTALLDDDANGMFTSADGEIARQRGFACTAPPVEQVWAPYIAQASVGEVTGVLAEISAEVLDDKQEITEVRAVIYPPTYTQPDSSEEIIPELPPVILQAQENNQYRVVSDQFREAGTYRILIYADDGDGLTSRPQEIIVQVEAPKKLYLPLIMR